ncbi:helix-turn-helix transcriptional regulator [Vibrio parahaemolyticus]|uniref:helix-turn-helix domain-containing protein n=1 Tax=Vibrio parahaemolyticus TaxID=670 RepID=UPI001C92FA94|nr:helix-turn-helix transcriptional regulator [Vibrio parahaemolyticus]EJG1787382.1 helix-turn-helix transcriptional regulator [Vibrio parahaemolyticus]MBY4651953.1 helix-turn-helix domain-containing protein [Vibrio parahaemolyticus]
MNKPLTKREDEIKVISTEVTDLGLGCIAIDVEIKWMDKTFNFQRGFDPEACEIDESLDDDGFDELCSFVDEYAEESGEFDSDEFFENLNKRVIIHHKATAFEAELKKIGITQSEFCERIGMTRQTISGWKNAGKYPDWLKYALKGMPLIINEEKTVTINGENYIHVDDPLLVSFNGQLISIFEAVDGTYIISKADLDLNPATEDCGEYTKTKSFNSLDECHEFISKVANGRPYNDCAVHLDIDSMLN